MPSNQVWRNAINKALLYKQLQTERHLCCDPYDCMCHEMCGSELGYCGGCRAFAESYNDMLRYCSKRNVDLRQVFSEVDNIVEQQRMDYYKHTKYIENAPAHWSDGGGYE